MRSVQMADAVPEDFTEPDRPTPTLWCGRDGEGRETRLDTETSVTLACVVGRIFETAESWSALIEQLRQRDFALVFEGDRLALLNLANGVSLCTCSSIGHSFAALKARLGKPGLAADSRRLVAPRVKTGKAA